MYETMKLANDELASSLPRKNVVAFIRMLNGRTEPMPMMKMSIRAKLPLENGEVQRSI